MATVETISHSTVRSNTVLLTEDSCDKIVLGMTAFQNTSLTERAMQTWSRLLMQLGLNVQATCTISKTGVGNPLKVIDTVLRTP